MRRRYETLAFEGDEPSVALGTHVGDAERKTTNGDFIFLRSIEILVIADALSNGSQQEITIPFSIKYRS